MATQSRRSIVPRIENGKPLIPPQIRRAVLQLLQDGAFVTRTLRADWAAAAVFVLSDFQDPSFEWVVKCIREQLKGKRLVALLRADTNTLGAQLAIKAATSILFVDGTPVGCPTMLVGFGVDLTPLAWLGTVVTPSKGGL